MKKKIRIIVKGFLCVLMLISFFGCSDNDGGNDNVKPQLNDNKPPEDGTKTNGSILDSIEPYDGDRVRIAFIGDSITFGFATGNPETDSYPAQFAEMIGSKYFVGNFGRSGSYVLPAESPYNYWKQSKSDRSYRKTEEYVASKQFEPDIVVILLGTNDHRSLTCDEAVEEFKESLIDLANEYRNLPSVKKVYIGTSFLSTANNQIYARTTGYLQGLQKEAAEAGGFEIIDIGTITREYFDVMMNYTSDRLHPNKTIYKEVAGVLWGFFTDNEYVINMPEVSDSGVVYVKTGGLTGGDGSTPEKALNSLAKAAGLLRESGGTIIICGHYIVSYDMPLPVSKNTITVTSTYEGINYEGTFSMEYSLCLNGDYVFDKLAIKGESPGLKIVFNNHDVKFTSEVTFSGQEIKIVEGMYK
jgi:lysophospholipase L1-like esterase